MVKETIHKTVNILIAGQGSFIGQNFIRHSRYRMVEEVSLLTTPVTEINFSPYDVVIHLAAIVHQSRTIPEEEYFKINRDLCLEVAEKAKIDGVKQFIFLSTSKVYGQFNPELGSWDEFSVCEPEDAYGCSKLEAELALKKIETNNFIVTIVRTPVVYGPGIRANMRSLINLVRRIPVLPLGGINNYRNFTFIRNLVYLLDRVIELRISGLFIAKDEESLSTTELVRIISEALDKKRVLVKFPKFIIKMWQRITPGLFDRLYGSFSFNNSHTKNILGYKPPYSTREGIFITVNEIG